MTHTLPRRAVLIVNAASRRGADAFEEARSRLVEAGIELTAAEAVSDPEQIDGKVIAAIETGAEMVILGGGDGTLSENIDHFVGKDSIFALLPLGTANSFARTMGIPLDLPGAVAVIHDGAPRKIDLGQIEDDYFLNNAALGLAPKVAETVPHGLKRSLGRLGYLLWAGWSAASFRAFRLVVEDGSQRHRLWATEVRIANGRFHGGVELIDSASVESGEIVVQAVEGRSLVGLGINYAASALRHRSRRQTVREFHGRELRITTRPRLKVSIDGELGPETPFTARVAAAAVTIAAPRG
ncbi:YegS/Rv2252/BmrU family lipid kinase [Sphingomonas ginkgonis]|uniref:YegS/Rv2252/BmrU family lipid kinase n=1 Tax=Sphingomonas ginkgonis TaxID=2315330 RepID=A0A429V8W0_9SPHN|nr:YegS/Rv2252/BmrU family lipid kinase [Sphingomonas ginkgonis]RST30364.1 YegS/Rv2252/BmrU family lipid kinase [Sphingomonas ginkgonis]